MVSGGRKNIFSTIVDIDEGRYYFFWGGGNILRNKETLGCYVGITKIWGIKKHFAGSFHQAYTSYS